MDLTEQKIKEIEESLKSENDENNTEQTGEPAEQKKLSIPISDIVFQVEKMGNDYLSKIHSELSYPDEKIQLHSEMLAAVLEKHFSPDMLEKSPEYILLAYTVLLAAEGLNKFKNLKEQGKITVKNSKKEMEKTVKND